MLFISLLLSSAISFAAPLTPAESKRIQDGCRAKIADNPLIPAETINQSRALCASTEMTRQTTERLKTDTQNLESKGTACEVTVSRGSSLWAFVTGSSTVDTQSTQNNAAKCAEEVKKRQAELTEYKGAVSENERSLAATEKAYADQMAALNKSTTERKSIDDLVNKNFMDVKLSIFNAKLNNAEAATTLNTIASAVDNSVLGLYMRDRMAGMLNSDVMCAAVKQCPKIRNVRGSQLNDVFNGKMKTSAADVTGGAVAKPAGRKVKN